LPVIATDSGGNRELVKHGVTGYLIPSWDSMELVERVRELRANPDAARSMGMEGRRLIDTRYTVGRLIAGTLDAYEAALGLNVHA